VGLGVALILGAAMGSFLNAVSIRLTGGEQFVRGPSRCPHCHHALGPIDLVPLLSFIVLRGRCRFCHQRIAAHYPLVELAVAGLFAFTFAYAGATAYGAFLAVELSLLTLLFLTDLRAHVLPDEVSLPAIALAVLGVLWFRQSISGALLGALVGGGFFLLQYLVSKGKWIGGGDIRLGFLLGLLLGWPLTLLALLLAYFAGGMVSAVLLLLRRASMGSQLPFGTFLTVATAVSLFFGRTILQRYGLTA
jgi:prepilin signal peptidase PulO-like enzyme (type II secretory pathway)